MVALIAVDLLGSASNIFVKKGIYHEEIGLVASCGLLRVVFYLAVPVRAVTFGSTRYR